jgi:hypothetical protein
MSGISTHVNMCSKDGVDAGSFRGLSGVLWDHSGGQEVFFMGVKNFEVPEAVDSDISSNITQIIRL